ncbi:deoxyribodipyrimidine photo-lyase [Flammeovirga yaeyamensis]|uniref:Deoxyribodipyrimidine photo-lyase n=1 Tax=Flammeovirga yaeyamensis TaxID=367791 RepID=A0AAX1N8I8_9BACT|nr:deoxyribodipyrimidine photo-lyase [Flammeovirga yaeyamensis]MBB3698757.1 deoxyribodipyrimidine photo-lyase [Flammeovirga yaeyamensis]NMF37342.1 deoxyribodipyrimidine photo-lyase [Flammeovirga yaeyamensis]QWG03841.1 deoxyribodipyrimidine photo-lyase [Flammeovirga yaeyamensis]
MKKTKLNIVWLKRDLRTQDHLPLKKAEESTLPYLIIYILEPSVTSFKDTSQRHLQFIYHSVVSMNNYLKAFNHKVELLYGEALDVFSYLNDRFEIKEIFSYQESGIEITFTRDIKLKNVFNQYSIKWNEYQKDGVIRGINNRLGWDESWKKTMTSAVIKNEFDPSKSFQFEHPFTPPASVINSLKKYNKNFQPAGETNAWKYLASFAADRGKNYHKHISKPTESRKSCGRISPYLAWGNLSIRQSYQYLYKHPNKKIYGRAFHGILTRLKWHCHFIQKFETECEYEYICVNRGFETLTHENNNKLLNAWKIGNTGFPLIDATMRCLIQTGWINFRMRAMLVSFLCHHLDQDWRRGVFHLANLFLDYEPGIHFTQFQMQAGTTGVNTVRIYNPVKQSYDHDPKGVFIKKWVPELKDIPERYIHEPWKMTKLDFAFNNIEEPMYPNPIINLEERGKAARLKIYSHRKTDAVINDKNRILVLHTIRKNTSKAI